MQKLGETAEFKDRNLLLQGADPATEQGFTAVPNFILRNDQLTMGAKMTYAVLLHYARQEVACFPGQERVAKDIGIGVRSVVRYIAELEECGLISIVRRGQGRSNIYTLHVKALFWEKNKD